MDKKSAIDPQTVLKNFLAGTTGGVAAGGAVALAKHLGRLNRRAKERERMAKGKDDETLYINLPTSKSAAEGRDNMWNYAAGLLSLLGGAALGYKGVKGRYKAYQLNRAQRELDQAQQRYVKKTRGEEPENEKAAADGEFGWVSRIGGTTAALATLVALASGGLTNKFLNDRFPAVQPKKSGPKRILVRSQPSGKKEDKGQGIDKKVEGVGRGVDPDATESMVRTALSDEKRASESGFMDLVCAAARGRCSEIAQNTAERGLESTFELVKGASASPVDPVEANLALSWLCHDPVISPSLELCAAAEFYDMGSSFCKIARHIDPEDMEDLIAFSADLMRENRKSAFASVAESLPAVKEAGLGNVMRDRLTSRVLIADVLARAAGSGGSKEEEGEPEEEPAHMVDLDIGDEAARRFVEKHPELFGDQSGAAA